MDGPFSKAFHDRRRKKGKLISKDVSVKIKKFTYHKKIERLRNFNELYKKLKLVLENNYCSYDRHQARGQKSISLNFVGSSVTGENRKKMENSGIEKL